MIYSIRGKLMVKDTELAVVECGGVGYACRTTLSTLSQLQAVGNDVMLYTYLHVREDNIELFGFASQQELNCFKMLISVSGVGPKAALSILSDVTPEKFALLVASEDSKTLTRTKGIGAKTAQRIVLELKDKIVKENINIIDCLKKQVLAKNTLLIEKISTSQLDENNMKKVTLICKYKNSFVFNTVMTELSALDDVIKIRMNSDFDLS